ncbi:hypothetical protein Goari_004758, partial [Gossypium aridum]|nr:hypothetical protein [Gossypium aridum]
MLAFVGDVNIVGSNSGIGQATKRVRRRPKIPLDMDDLMVDEHGRKEGDETIEIVEGVPSITFPDRVSSLWRLRNPFQVMDLENDYYLVRFQYEEDYNKVLIRRSPWGDLWAVFNYLPVVAIFFFIVRDELDAQVVWIRLLGLPKCYYLECPVRAIGQNIRTVTKIDEHTNGVRRERFACLAVSVDLRKSLVPKVKINGCIQRVEYDSLLNFCFKCGLYGHNTDWCMANNEPLSDGQANWGVHTNMVE